MVLQPPPSPLRHGATELGRDPPPPPLSFTGLRESKSKRQKATGKEAGIPDDGCKHLLQELEAYFQRPEEVINHTDFKLLAAL